VRDFRFVQFVAVAAVLLQCVPACAEFILEFTDGRKITVSNYKEIDQSIKVYTSNGSFAFRKEDIARIVNVEQEQPTPPERSIIDAPLASIRQEKVFPAVPSAVTPRVTMQETLPTPPGWDETVGFVVEGLYRARFFIALFAGLKLLQFFLPTSFR
jgi:hypothetical protein